MTASFEVAIQIRLRQLLGTGYNGERYSYGQLGGAYRALASTLYFLGDFESARQYAKSGVQISRFGGVTSYAEFLDAPAVVCLCYQALSEWHLGEIASCHASIAEAISLRHSALSLSG